MRWKPYLIDVAIIGPLQGAAFVVAAWLLGLVIKDPTIRDIAFAVCALAIIVMTPLLIIKAPWRVPRPKKLPPFISGKTLRLADLVTGDYPMIDGVTFEDCSFQGPAVIVIDSTQMVLPQFNLASGDIESLLWEVEANKPYVQGAVILKNCLLRRCSFDKSIGLAAYPEGIAQLRELFKNAPRT